MGDGSLSALVECHMMKISQPLAVGDCVSLVEANKISPPNVSLDDVQLLRDTTDEAQTPVTAVCIAN